MRIQSTRGQDCDCESKGDSKSVYVFRKSVYDFAAIEIFDKGKSIIKAKA